MWNRVLHKSALEGFEKYLRNDEKSTATIRKYCHDARMFLDYIKDLQVTKEVLIEYKQHLIGRKYSIRSINSMLASLNSLFTYLGWMECRVKSLKTQRRIYCPEEKELSRQEYIRLVEASRRKGNARLEMILQTICGTGIRVSELEFITVEAVQRGEAVVACKGKMRTVFIVKKLRKRLFAYARKRKIRKGSIFITRSGKTMDRSNIWREMKKLCTEAAVDPRKVFPHNLRHLFARTFYEMKKDIVKLSDILGHGSIDTTRVYIISSGLEHQKMLESMRLII